MKLEQRMEKFEGQISAYQLENVELLLTDAAEKMGKDLGKYLPETHANITNLLAW